MLFNTFKETVFLKKISDLHRQYDALIKLKEEYPNNKKIDEELYICKKGLDGENEIGYQLSKSSIGMYVIRDLNLKYEDLSAQIDYVIITRAYVYLIECKNLLGKITINERGEFVRKYNYYGRKIEKGLYSPIRQVEAQKEVLKKCMRPQKALEKVIYEKLFESLYKTLVVIANDETVLDIKRAPNGIKDRVIRADALVKRIESDLAKSDRIVYNTRKEMEEWADNLLSWNEFKKIDYYKYYKERFIGKEETPEELKERLIKFRKERAAKKGMPVYYVFTDEELEKLVYYNPLTLEQLINYKILAPIKIKTHGEAIIEIINKRGI